MIRPLLFLAGSLALSGLRGPPAYCQDTDIVVRQGDSVHHVSWGEPRCTPPSFRGIREEAAIHGGRGHYFDANGGCGHTRQLPFLADAWTSFYLKLEVLEEGEAPPSLIDTFNLLSCHYSIRLQKEQPKAFISFRLVRDGLSKQHGLQVVLRSSSDPGQALRFQAPFSVNVTHCVEAHVRFRTADSVDFTLFMDGDSLYSVSTAYYFRKDFLFVTLFGQGGFKEPWRLRFDEFTFSDKRPLTVPSRPSECGERISGNDAVLWCAPFSTSFRNESVVATRWKVFLQSRPRFPVFDAEDPDPLFRFSRAVPFPLDSGEYAWQAAFKNNFGYWSDWSTPRKFIIAKERPLSVRLTQGFLAESGADTPLQRLAREQPCDLVIRLRPDPGWDQVGYIMALIRHVSFTLGHPGNYGGFCDPERSYIVNVSFGTIGPSGVELTLYEKFEPDALPRRVVTTGEPSRFLLGRSRQDVHLDTLKGEIRLSLRLLREAREGEWELTAFAFDGQERLSNRVYFPFSVEAVKPRSRKGPALAGLIALAAALFFTVLAWRKRRPGKKDAEYLKLVEYLSARLKEDLNFEKVRTDLKYGVHQLHKMLRRNGADSLPRLLNDLRIRKAKDLLADPDKNISEVGFEVGFEEARYFTKVFKDYTGLTPSDYRNKAMEHS